MGGGAGGRPPPPSFSFSSSVQLSRGCIPYFTNHKIKNPPTYPQLLRLLEKEQEICSFLVFFAFAPLFMVTGSVFVSITSIVRFLLKVATG